MRPETDKGRADKEGVLWKGARPNRKYLFDSLTVIKYLFKIETPICRNAEALSFSCRVKEQLIIKYTFYELSTKPVMFSQSLAKHL